jgi:hypothetical protein
LTLYGNDFRAAAVNGEISSRASSYRPANATAPEAGLAQAIWSCHKVVVAGTRLMLRRTSELQNVTASITRKSRPGRTVSASRNRQTGESLKRGRAETLKDPSRFSPSALSRSVIPAGEVDQGTTHCEHNRSNASAALFSKKIAERTGRAAQELLQQ